MFIDFFEGAIGKSHYFDSFGYNASGGSGPTDFFNRLPSSAQAGLLIRASVTGGVCTNSTVQFALNDHQLSYFRDGLGSFGGSVVPELISGTSDVVPNGISVSTPYGFYLHGISVSTGSFKYFASSYRYSGRDYCTGTPISGGERLTLSYESA